MPRIIKGRDTDKDGVSAYRRLALDEEASNALQAAVDPAVILEQARQDAEEKVREAYAEGMRRGMEAGEEKFSEAVGESAQMLSQAAETLAQAREEFLDALEPQMVQLATSIASKIIDRETQVSAEIVKHTARSVLERILDEERVVLRINPQDLETLREHRIQLLEEFEGIKQLELQRDDTVAPGGCIAVTEHLRIDGRLESQLEQIMNQLME
ncbi:MAG: FliH/SctL family protein [Candidatus Hydrogenedentes bacterium]|nr:FliH/SctL family protein [Candidatus Hydrogenedentota bacterium]